MRKEKIKHKYLFIAVQPEYAYKLISKQKDIELRKMCPHVRQGDYVIIYASAPVKAVLGFGKIKNIIVCSPDDMWKKYSERLGIDKGNFCAYYYNHTKAVGIEFDMVKAVKPIGLSELKRIDPKFHPPQIYRYVTNNDINKLLKQKD